ncbi:MAG TPA: ATP-dependent zinc metalloprotease FtsH [Clostridia bacterium]|nr:ATP-dependent zinc metalloprotease FtsH [Clostridia bacterium]
MLGATYFANNHTQDKTEYYEIIQFFDSGEVTGYTLNLSSGELKYTLEDKKEVKTFNVPSVNMFLEDIQENVREHNRSNPDDLIEDKYITGSGSAWLMNIVPSLLLGVLVVVLLLFMFKRMNQTMSNETNRTLSFGKAKVKQAKDEARKTTFADVAGADEEKEELGEIVDYLKDSSKFTILGARIPKGVLLVGPPGTGKTLLARAVAGEANAPFFSISGSDFVEMYVGVGASRVRDLFDQAKKNSPSIIFIDEIDAVGRHRGAGMGGGHDEREQTLNQLLVEMDGFGANEGVIIIAATNRPDILDPALLRPGRFDRQITVGAPDTKGREEILYVHAKGKPLAPDVDLSVIARSTTGFTGADLENLLNEAALLAARRDRKAITMEEIEEATIKVVMGTEKKSRKINDKEKRLTAYHEGGHAVATYYLEDKDPVHQISIIPRGLAGGYTMSMPKEDRSFATKNDMLDNIVVLMGGRVAEAVVLGDISTGASNDIERATEMARNMVTKYGMSDILGPISYSSGSDEVFLGKDFSHTRRYSESIASEIDDEVNKIIRDSYDRTYEIITNHLDKLHVVARRLLKDEKIDGEVFKQIMDENYVEQPDEFQSDESVKEKEEAIETNQVEEKEEPNEGSENNS